MHTLETRRAKLVERLTSMGEIVEGVNDVEEEQEEMPQQWW